MPRKLPIHKPSATPMVQSLGELGKAVRNQRALALLRIDDAAALCGVSSDLMSRLENGKPVGLDKLLLVLHGLGLRMLVAPTVDALLMLDPEVLNPKELDPPGVRV
jgi:transcriptional regulator with XRE-family HTH domain